MSYTNPYLEEYGSDLWSDFVTGLENLKAMFEAKGLTASADAVRIVHESIHTNGIRDSELSPLPLPKIGVCFMFEDGGLAGTQPAPIREVSMCDDGCVSITIDYWPDNKE